MKKNYLKKILLFSMAFCFSLAVAAQNNGSLNGTVLDSKGEGVPGATVKLSRNNKITATDIDGKFSFTGLEAGSETVVVSSIGFKTTTNTVELIAGQGVSISVALKDDAINLNEAVVVGYGTTQKKDLTGSISSVNSKDFNKGANSTPEQLVTGKISGVKITSSGGAPGSGSRIRIRGGTSINASNDPLIVIDGVPIDNNSISGSPNPLSLINPADIENITVLKDASSTAIYGSRAANGVIIITTKKGESNKFKVELNSVTSYYKIIKYADVLSADDFRKVVNDSGTTTQKSLLGASNTDWQKEIYQSALSFDNNITFSGGIKQLPYRLTLGYLSQEGILKRAKLDRFSVGLQTGKDLFNKNLNVDVNAKFAQSKSFFPDAGAIGSAVSFDPTQSVNSDTAAYGNYFEWLDNSNKPITVATRNPVGLLNQRDDESTVNRFIGNIKLDYKIPMVKNLRAILSLGTDVSHSSGTVYVPATAASSFTQKGVDNQYQQDKTNQLFDFYFNYTKDLSKIKSKLDVTAGYSWQFWHTESPSYPGLNAEGDTITPVEFDSDTENGIISFFGRVNYTLMEKYLFTVNFRNDNSSRFSKDNRAGYFPSAAFAWRISDESFLKNSKVISQLKLRVGYGIVGQQDGIADYAYIANYSQGTSTAQYQFGNQYYYVLRPDAYDPNLKWEETTTTNGGIDFGFYNGRINGSFDLYKKETEDLLAVIPNPAGTNFSNTILTNVGSLENTGFEITLNFLPIVKKNFSWEVSTNFSYNKNEITKLSKAASDTSDILVGGISGGISQTVQVQSVGYPVYSFYVYEQKYGDDGKPLEGKYVDRNGDGIINSGDLYRYEKADADYTLGFSTTFNYKRWALTTSLRGEFGNYMYNNFHSNAGSYQNVGGSVKALSNLSTSYLDTKFKTPQYLSDYYIENASFVKMDYLALGYNFKKFFGEKLGLRATFSIQNVLTITDYTGIDPEIAGGIDNNIYPRPRIYSLGLNIQL